jgi:hypothetical protein
LNDRKERRFMSKRLVVCVFAIALIGWALPSAADPGRGSNVQCYVWANNPTAAIGAPYVSSAPYSYNAVGRSAANFVTRTGVGIYSVTCKGVGGGPLFGGSASWGPGGHVQVRGSRFLSPPGIVARSNKPEKPADKWAAERACNVTARERSESLPAVARGQQRTRWGGVARFEGLVVAPGRHFERGGGEAG